MIFSPRSIICNCSAKIFEKPGGGWGGWGRKYPPPGNLSQKSAGHFMVLSATSRFSLNWLPLPLLPPVFHLTDCYFPFFT